MADGNGIVDGNGSAASKEEIQTFEKGDLVVYPNHGAGTVSGVEEKTILGEERRYYIVYVPDGGLTLNIPADGDSGLRSCADDEEVAEALEILRGGPEDMPAHWNHRLKHNQEKIRSGEISSVAEVVRDLSAHGGDRGLSTGERNLLAKARRILVSEVALGKSLEIDEAEALVDGALRGDGKA
ncbi:MAG TPA: CarD family transcriptional regulator [Rubrobacteraceae bacterium]|jgi:CarD family transcriptional regulator|nr:CarD family transcriptional regulator [Rubrobacteraceae bacterium]